MAIECGKQVRIRTEGEDTELDRSLIEAVRDPLTHLVRNAVDHGIEAPSDRGSAAKAQEEARIKAQESERIARREVKPQGRDFDKKPLEELKSNGKPEPRSKQETVVNARGGNPLKKGKKEEEKTSPGNGKNNPEQDSNGKR